MRTHLALALVLLSPAALAWQCEQCSVTSAGVPAVSASFVGATDDSGTWVVFSSAANNLIPGDTLDLSDVFLRDRNAGTTTVLSISTGGQLGNANSNAPSISGNGQLVCFVSVASNLVTGDTNARNDVFVRNLSTGQLQLASRAGFGAPGSDHSFQPRLSPDATKLVFVSKSSNFVAGDTNGFDDVFVRTLATGAMVRASVATGDVQSNGNSSNPSLSADGNFVVFTSAATNLVATDSNGLTDVFVHDLTTGVTTLVSSPPAGGVSNGEADHGFLSADARFVVFSSRGTNLSTGVPNTSFYHPYLHDRLLNTTVRLDFTATGAYANKHGTALGVSIDGRHAWFRSAANQVAAGDVNNFEDVFVRDVQLGVTTKLTKGYNGAPIQVGTDAAVLSSNGAYVVVETRSPNMVPTDYNNVGDVFLIPAEGPNATLYVDQDGDGYGDPSSWSSGAPGAPGLVTLGGDCDDADPATNPGAADPCDGRDRDCDGTTDEGCITYYCTTSTTTHGCHPLMFVGGYASATAQSPFHLAAFDVEGARAGLFFYGLAPAAGVWAPGSTSTKCVQSPIQRMGAIQSGGTNGQCDGLLLYDMNAYLQSHPGALGAPFPAGARLYAQAWFRDPSAPKGTNLSDAVEILLGP
ncbi:MAG: PD40 domain-containing protein [Planctomycetaceae bacterium]|nr:PD40 domain-containing protein [Planctomycetaceae bacterium]